MNIKIDSKKPGVQLDDNDVEVVKQMPEIIRAATPIVLSINSLVFIYALLAKGLYISPIGSVVAGIIRALWLVK